MVMVTSRKTQNLMMKMKMRLRRMRGEGEDDFDTLGKLENTFLTFLTCYKCKKYSFKKVGAT